MTETRQPTPAGQPAGSLADYRVVIVEDDPTMRGLVRRLLQHLGVAEVIEAANGAAALEAMAKAATPFDLVICDLEMPGSDGVEFMRMAAERGLRSPIMVLSGKPAALLSSVEIMARAYGLNLLATQEKPPTLPGLKRALERCRVLTPPPAPDAGEPLHISEILGGLAAGQFEPFFQPKVEVQTGRLVGCEALARWRHPMRGVLPAGAFIEVIEREGQVDQLTWLMVEQSARACRRWIDHGLMITVSVNLSVTTLADVGLSARLFDLVQGAGLRPENMVLEITESSATTHMARSLETLARLRLKGFGLSIDDFGVGFSSMQQLARAPFTELKVDRSFVSGAAGNDRARVVLDSSVALAHRLGLVSVGEGVESDDDLACLAQVGCTLAQGYHIARPMSGNDFLAWATERAKRAHTP